MAQAESAPRLSFFDHVEELRMRVMRCLAVFLIGFVAIFLLGTEPILEFLRQPLFKVLPPDQQKLYFTSLFENFLTHLKVAGYASVFFLSPFFFTQIWAFIAPGLLPNERKLVLPFVLAATFFFLAGAGFAYGVLFPVGFKYFVTFGSQADVPLLTIDAYYTTCLKLMLLFGLAFEMPVLICFFGFLGIVDAKFLRENRRTAILAITFISAVSAPPDAVSMLMLMAPLILMYEGAIYVVGWLGVRRSESQPSEPVPSPLEGRSRP